MKTISHSAPLPCSIVTPNRLSPTKKTPTKLDRVCTGPICVRMSSEICVCQVQPAPPLSSYVQLETSQSTWLEWNVVRNDSVQSHLLLNGVCRVNTQSVLLWLAGCSNAQRLLAVSLFHMLTQSPERRRLSCGTMWPYRTNTSSLTFLCACSLGEKAFHAPLIPQKALPLQLPATGKLGPVMCYCTVSQRVEPTLTLSEFDHELKQVGSIKKGVIYEVFTR